MERMGKKSWGEILSGELNSIRKNNKGYKVTIMEKMIAPQRCPDPKLHTRNMFSYVAKGNGGCKRSQDWYLGGWRDGSPVKHT